MCDIEHLNFTVTHKSIFRATNAVWLLFSPLTGDQLAKYYSFNTWKAAKILIWDFSQYTLLTIMISEKRINPLQFFNVKTLSVVKWYFRSPFFLPAISSPSHFHFILIKLHNIILCWEQCRLSAVTDFAARSAIAIFRSPPVPPYFSVYIYLIKFCRISSHSKGACLLLYRAFRVIRWRWRRIIYEYLIMTNRERHAFSYERKSGCQWIYWAFIAAVKYIEWISQDEGRGEREWNIIESSPIHTHSHQSISCLVCLLYTNKLPVDGLLFLSWWGGSMKYGEKRASTGNAFHFEIFFSACSSRYSFELSGCNPLPHTSHTWVCCNEKNYNGYISRTSFFLVS